MHFLLATFISLTKLCRVKKTVMLFYIYLHNFFCYFSHSSIKLFFTDWPVQLYFACVLQTCSLLLRPNGANHPFSWRSLAVKHFRSKIAAWRLLTLSQSLIFRRNTRQSIVESVPRVDAVLCVTAPDTRRIQTYLHCRSNQWPRSSCLRVAVKALGARIAAILCLCEGTPLSRTRHTAPCPVYIQSDLSQNLFQFFL